LTKDGTESVDKVEGQVEDRRVEFVKRNWTGRFLRAEVNYYDYQQVMSRIRTWDDWLPAWTDKAAEYEKLAEDAEARGARHTAAEAWRRASMCWHFGKFNWFVDIEKSLHAQRRMNACFERALWSLDPPGEKVLIPYAAGKLAAILRRPAKATKPPVVVLIGGLDSVKEELQVMADYFLERGMATLALDGPGQGETGLSMKIEPAYEKPVAATIDFLGKTGGLDITRVGLYGQSLGGHYVIRASAFERRIKAAVSSSGPYSLADRWDRFSPTSRAGYQYRTGSKTPEETVEQLRPLDLTGVVEKVSCPLLVMHGTADEVVPFSEGERIAREAKHVTFWQLADGNHSLSNKHFEVRTGVADWLAEQLGADR
jgi:dienelactone hydrolase